MYQFSSGHFFNLTIINLIKIYWWKQTPFFNELIAFPVNIEGVPNFKSIVNMICYEFVKKDC